MKVLNEDKFARVVGGNAISFIVPIAGTASGLAAAMAISGTLSAVLTLPGLAWVGAGAVVYALEGESQKYINDDLGPNSTNVQAKNLGENPAF